MCIWTKGTFTGLSNITMAPKPGVTAFAFNMGEDRNSPAYHRLSKLASSATIASVQPAVHGDNPDETNSNDFTHSPPQQHKTQKLAMHLQRRMTSQAEGSRWALVRIARHSLLCLAALTPYLALRVIGGTILLWLESLIALFRI